MNASILPYALLVTLFLPGAASARGPQNGTAAGLQQVEHEQPANINTRYDVESASISGVDASRVSRGLRDDMQKLVGKKYDPEAAEDVARRLREELCGYDVAVKVRRGEQPEHVKVVFEAERHGKESFELRTSPLLYTTNDQFSLALVPGFETHHNYFSFGYISDANDLLERNAGWMFRYEHRKVGTGVVQLGLEYDYFHPSFEGETEAALAFAPGIPGIYRTREVFSPSVSVLPVPGIKVTFGASFNTLGMQYPIEHDEAAHAFTIGVQYQADIRSSSGLRHRISADYGLRDASRSLESDFLYTRHRAAGDYTLSVAHHEFGFHFEGGHLDGTAPLYERFTIGSATTLRGWDKFDVAPVGGSRLLYGSVDYHYRPFEVFYDFGKVWEAGLVAEWKHSLGIGLAWKNGFFMELGVPLRFHGVTPAFMFGFRQ